MGGLKTLFLQLKQNYEWYLSDMSVILNKRHELSGPPISLTNYFKIKQSHISFSLTSKRNIFVYYDISRIYDANSSNTHVYNK